MAPKCGYTESISLTGNSEPSAYFNRLAAHLNLAHQVAVTMPTVTLFSIET